MKLTVIIPTYRRNDRLLVGLQALAEQTLPQDRFEVLVVDDGSPEPAAPVVEQMSSLLPVRLLRKENGGLSSARTHGAEQAKGDVLLFLDDDIRVCPEFLAEHLSYHEASDRIVVLGALPHPPDMPLDSLSWYLEEIRHWDLFARFGSEENIPLPPLNGNSSVRRALFEESGGYDLAFDSYGGEDTDMGYRLRRMGLRFVYADKALGYHYHGKTFANYLHEMDSSGAAIVALVRKHPEVRERVNLDIVTAPFSSLGWSKRVSRLGLLTLERLPFLVRAMELGIGILGGLGLKRSLKPLYYLTAHFHFARGMRRALETKGELAG